MSECEGGTLDLKCPNSGDFWIDTQMGPMTLCWPCYQDDEGHNLALIREQIAKEIEALILKSCQVNHRQDEMQDGIEPYPCDCLDANFGYIRAAAIVRGEVKG